MQVFAVQAFRSVTQDEFGAAQRVVPLDDFRLSDLSVSNVVLFVPQGLKLGNFFARLGPRGVVTADLNQNVIGGFTVLCGRTVWRGIITDIAAKSLPVVIVGVIYSALLGRLNDSRHEGGQRYRISNSALLGEQAGNFFQGSIRRVNRRLRQKSIRPVVLRVVSKVGSLVVVTSLVRIITAVFRDSSRGTGSAASTTNSFRDKHATDTC